MTGQAVAAHHQPVAVLQRHRRQDVDVDMRLGADRAQDDVALRMVLSFLRLEEAVAHHLGDLAVVVRDLEDPVVANEVHPRIPDVRPVRHVALDHERCARGPHATVLRVGTAVAVHRFVRAHHGVVQRYGHVALRVGVVAVADGLHDHGGRHRPADSAAHAVGDHRQPAFARGDAGVCRFDDKKAVLVRLADAADIGV